MASPPMRGTARPVALARGERVVEGSDATRQAPRQRGERERQGEGGGERDDRGEHACLTRDLPQRDSPFGASCRTAQTTRCDQWRDPMPSTPDCLLLEGCDFDRFPAGGQLAVARQLMAAFGPRLALVGISTDGTPVGRWVEKELDGRRFHFFATGRREVGAGRPPVPARLSRYLGLRRHREAILSLGARAAFTQAPEDLLAVAGWGLDRLCYCFPGVENPLAASRYPWARPLAALHDRVLFRALRRADAILASADDEAIDGARGPQRRKAPPLPRPQPAQPLRRAGLLPGPASPGPGAGSGATRGARSSSRSAGSAG